MQQIKNQAIINRSSFINGEWCASEASFRVINPATNLVIAEIAEVEIEQVIKAINAASEAQLQWQQMEPQERSKRLTDWAQLMLENIVDLSRLLTLEQGKPLAESMAEIKHAAEYTQVYSEEAPQLFEPQSISAPAGQRALVVNRPVGVVSAITPWNFPCSMVMRKAAAAIAAGCSVILKPSDLTPLSALALAKLSQQAGIPKGVFNVVVGTNAQAIGELLSQHPKIAKLSFTGSTAVGKKLLAQCAQGVTRTAMELGGNAPFIIFEDADIDAAVEGAIASKFRNAGQTCVSANRFLVQDSIFLEFKNKLINKIKQLQIGDGLVELNTIGPLINQSAVEKMKRLEQSALAEGAVISFQAEQHAHKGYYFPPTVLENVTANHAIFEQEIFGPLVCLTQFTTEQQAVQLANQTEHGLCGYVYTRSAERQARLAVNLSFGMLGINQAKLSNPAAPFGGQKQSGMGREGGRYGVEEYLDPQYLCRPQD